LIKGDDFNWSQFHSYRVFDEFLQRFVIDQKSYITRHEKRLDFESAFDEINTCFSEGFNDSKETFDRKVRVQFQNASEDCKIVFSNVEYLWAMPVGNILPNTKQDYALRWFNDGNKVNIGDSFFFGYPHTIANPGSWYLRNKYWEMIALLRVLSLVVKDREVVDLNSAKERIAEFCYSAIYKGGAEAGRFAVRKVCGAHSALLHLCDPEKYESIISESHKNKISEVFRHVIADHPEIVCREKKIRLIRERLYENYEDLGDSDRKYRWFFYQTSIEPLWIDKKGAYRQLHASINDEVSREQAALDYSEEEGVKESVVSYRLYRSAKLAAQAKRRDNFTCRACQFTFQEQIVHVHHLDPLSEILSPRKTTLDDLVTLCPNCHYIAHYFLRKDDRFKKLNELLPKLISLYEKLRA
jgi:hypothetical protein